jgi:prepilin-type N-terminal cleavage/methylation domain-containing protein
METKRKSGLCGFTIVELLTVMAIIAILMGLLLPAMQAVRKLAKDTSQRAEFKTIEVALDGYHNENGMYPESSVSTSGTPYTVGAQKFTEALVGRDMLGFDPKSTWDARTDETRSDAEEVYSSLDISGTTQAQVDSSLKRRQPTYLNIDNVAAFQINQLFDDTAIGNVYPGKFKNDGSKSASRIAAPVMTDVYKAKKVTLPSGDSEMAGTPILYYKANTNSTLFPDTMKITSVTTDDMPGTYADTVTDANLQGFIYNILDNDDLVKLNQMMKPTTAGRHHFNEQYTETVTYGTGGTATTATANGVWLFYNAITNPKMTSQVRPYNADKYILISAGHDGIYGTKDDICNFEK